MAPLANVSSPGQRYNHVANQNKIANEAAYKRWVESYTPVQIHENNNARRYLWRLKGSPKYRLRLVKDERQPKKFTSAFIDFSVERHRSGDLKHMSLADAARLVGQEWKSLNDADKKVGLTRSSVLTCADAWRSTEVSRDRGARSYQVRTGDEESLAS